MPAGRRTPPADDGLGLVEVVVAMLLFAVLALAILPAALQATRLSAANRDDVSADAFASGQLAGARARFPDEGANSCAQVSALARTGIPDPAESGLLADMTVADCPGAAAYPAALTVTVVVRDPDGASATGTPLVTMASKIVVTGP